jgi:MurNAc alpha-1-phosphate uridylyltransferase
MTLKQAFIFAAGRGERMRPITNSIPKPLVKVKGKAIIDYAIEKLDKISSIEKIIINGFYLAEKLEEHIKNLNNPKIIFSNETEKLETGGGLVFAKDKIDLNAPLLTINGDVLWIENEVNDIENLYKNWLKNQENNDCEILLGLKKTKDYFGYENENGGDFKLIENQNLLKKEMTHAFIGMQIINPKILERAPEKYFSMSHFYKNALMENGVLKNIKGFELAAKYFHIGTPQALIEVEKLI